MTELDNFTLVSQFATKKFIKSKILTSMLLIFLKYILYFCNQLSCIFIEFPLQWPTYQMSGRNDEPKSWFWIKIKSRKGPMCKVRGLKFIKVMLHGFRTIHISHKHIFRLYGIPSPSSIFSGSKNCHFPTHLPLQVLT